MDVNSASSKRHFRCLKKMSNELQLQKSLILDSLHILFWVYNLPEIIYKTEVRIFYDWVVFGRWSVVHSSEHFQAIQYSYNSSIRSQLLIICTSYLAMVEIAAGGEWTQSNPSVHIDVMVKKKQLV